MGEQPPDRFAIIARWHHVDEVIKAFAEERRRGVVVLFPICIDNAVFATDEASAVKQRDSRHIGDFRRWKYHDAYQKASIGFCVICGSRTVRPDVACACR